MVGTTVGCACAPTRPLPGRPGSSVTEESARRARPTKAANRPRRARGVGGRGPDRSRATAVPFAERAELSSPLGEVAGPSSSASSWKGESLVTRASRCRFSRCASAVCIGEKSVLRSSAGRILAVIVPRSVDTVVRHEGHASCGRTAEYPQVGHVTSAIEASGLARWIRWILAWGRVALPPYYTLRRKFWHLYHTTTVTGGGSNCSGMPKAPWHHPRLWQSSWFRDGFRMRWPPSGQWPRCRRARWLRSSGSARRCADSVRSTRRPAGAGLADASG